MQEKGPLHAIHFLPHNQTLLEQATPQPPIQLQTNQLEQVTHPLQIHSLPTKMASQSALQIHSQQRLSIQEHLNTHNLRLPNTVNHHLKELMHLITTDPNPHHLSMHSLLGTHPHHNMLNRHLLNTINLLLPIHPVMDSN